MDVELPDGTVVEGVPDGLSQRDLVSMLSKNGHDTSWYKAPEPGLIDRVKSALTPNPDREPMPQVSDTINAGWTSPPSEAIILPGSVMDGYTPPAASDQGMPIEAGMGPMRQGYYDTTRAGLIAAPVQTHAAATKDGGQVGKIAAATIDERRARDARLQAGDTTPRTSRDLADDTTAALTAQPLRSEASKEANRQWLTENSAGAIEGIKRFTNMDQADAEAELAQMVKYGVKPAWVDGSMPEATLAQAASANIGATGPALQKALLGLSEAAADQPFLQLPWQDYAKRTPRELEAMVGDLDKQIRAARNVGGKIEAGSWNDVVSSMGPSLAVNLPPLIAASLVAARNPAAGMAIANGGLGVMGLQKFGDNYLKGQMKGLSAADNLAQASLGMAAEVIPEKLSLNALFTVFKTMGKGAAVETVKAFAKQQLTEHSTEQITTIADHLIDKAYTEPNKSLESLWSEMKQTGMATAIQAPILAGGGIMAHGAGQAAISAQQRMAEGRDLTAGRDFDPSQIDAAARQSLDPTNAQIQRTGLLAAPSIPRAHPADILAAPDVDTAIAAAVDSVAAVTDAGTALPAAELLDESPITPQSPAQNPAPAIPVTDLPVPAAAAPNVDSYLKQNAAGKWQLSRPVELAVKDAVIAEMDRRNQEGTANAAQDSAQATMSAVPEKARQESPLPAEVANVPPPKPAPQALPGQQRPVVANTPVPVAQEPAREAAPVPDAAVQDQGADRGAVEVGAGGTVVAVEDELRETRNPPEVSTPMATGSVKFETSTLAGPKTVSAKLYELPGYKGPQLAVATYKARTGQGFRVYLPKSGMLLQDSNGVGDLASTLKIAVQRINQAKLRLAAGKPAVAQNPEASRPNPVAESQVPAPSEPGDGGVAPTQDKAAPAPEERAYTKGQAEVLARRMTHQGLPSEAYPHPTQAGMWAIRVPVEQAAAPAAEVEKIPTGSPKAESDAPARVAETPDQMFDYLRKTKGGVVVDGKILYPAIKVIGMGGTFQWSGDGVSKLGAVGDTGTIQPASESEAADVMDALEKDQAQIVVLSQWGGSGRGTGQKVVKVLHSPRGMEYKSRDEWLSRVAEDNKPAAKPDAAKDGGSLSKAPDNDAKPATPLEAFAAAQLKAAQELTASLTQGKETPATLPSEAAKEGEGLYDAARAQELKNSIAEGEMIAKSGKTVAGRKMTSDEIELVKRSVESSKAKLAALGKPDTGPTFNSIEPKQPVKINPDTLSREVLSKMDKALKAMGYDSRGADDVLKSLKTMIARNGVIESEFPDWIAAYEKATGSAKARVEKLAQKKMEESAATNVDFARVKELGTTTDLREAGYIRANGALVDLSGKREGGSPGQRSYDHREVGDGSKAMQEFMALGNIRMDMAAGTMDISAEPTPAQESVIRQIAAKHNGELVIDLEDGLGEESGSYYLKPERHFSQEYPVGTKPERILADIRRFFAGEMPVALSKSSYNSLEDDQRSAVSRAIDRAIAQEQQDSAPTETKRGAGWLKIKLRQAQNKGELSAKAVEMVEFLVKQNPALVKYLAVVIDDPKVMDGFNSTEYQDTADKLDRALTAMGFDVRQERSRVSVSTYLYAKTPDYKYNEDTGEVVSGKEWKVRVSDHELPSSYEPADLDVAPKGQSRGDIVGDWIDAIEWISDKTGVKPKGRALVLVREAQFRREALAKEAAERLAALRAAEESRKPAQDKFRAWVAALPDEAAISVSNKGIVRAEYGGKVDIYGPKPFGFSKAFDTKEKATRYYDRTPSTIAGNYNPLTEVMTLFRGNVSDTTAVHEILHHLERMMPAEMQADIRKEWALAVTSELQKATKAKDQKRIDYFTAVLAGDQKKAAELLTGKGMEGFNAVSPAPTFKAVDTESDGLDWLADSPEQRAAVDAIARRNYAAKGFLDSVHAGTMGMPPTSKTIGSIHAFASMQKEYAFGGQEFADVLTRAFPLAGRLFDPAIDGGMTFVGDAVLMPRSEAFSVFAPYIRDMAEDGALPNISGMMGEPTKENADAFFLFDSMTKNLQDEVLQRFMRNPEKMFGEIVSIVGAYRDEADASLELSDLGARGKKQVAALGDYQESSAMFESERLIARIMKPSILNDLAIGQDYQYLNPSEFWAVRMTSTMAARFEAKSIWARSLQWLREALEHIKGVLGLKSDHPLLKALDDLIARGDGEFVSKDMLGSSKVYTSFAGERSATADEYPLSNAQQRVDAGDNAETVRKETGWFKGVDGKWRFEINDSDATLKKDAIGRMTTDIFLRKQKTSRSLSLGSILDHPKLFAAYPFMKNYRVTMTLEGAAGGFFEGDEDGWGRITLNAKGDHLSTLLHEIQHGIQTREGFATGWNYRGPYYRGMRQKVIAANIKRLQESNVHDPENPFSSEDNLLSDEEIRSMAERNADDLDQRYGVYQRMAGEVEARNTQARKSMTEAERRATPPSKTADVADSEAIVVFNGKEMAAPVEMLESSEVYASVEKKGIVKDATQQAKETVLRLAGRPMLDPGDPFAAENARLREHDQSLWANAKKQLRRYLAPGGLLPQPVFDEKIKRDSEFQAVEFDVRHLVGGLDRAIKADFGMPLDKLSKDQMRKVSDALAGDVLSTLPEATKTAAVAMRQYIDTMSGEYLKIIQERIDAKMLKAIETDRDADKAQAINEIELYEKIKGNVGRYVHRSYQAFDDPKWFEKVPAGVLNMARAYLKQGYVEAGETDAKAAKLTEVTLHEILKNGTAYDSMESFIAESKLGAKDLSVLMRRKEVPSQIRALLGEYPDARLNFTKSATKMGRLIWNTRFLDRVRDIGMDAFFFEGKDRPPGATTQIAADGSEVYAPLNGLWTFPETAQAFKDALGKEQMSDLYRVIVRANGLVKYGKTVLSPTTAMRNWQSAMFFSLANGHFDLTQMKKSVAAFREQVAQTANGVDLKYLRHLKQLGVVYDVPYAGEMARLMDDARMEELLSTDKGDAVRWFRKANQIAQGFYTFGDDFWKIIGFENEKAGLMKAGLNLQEAEAEAAKRIRDTYPTYSMVGRGVQWLSRFPLAGTFVSFPSEIIRTSSNMLRTVASDLKSDNPKLRELGMRRAAGMVLVSSAFWALAALSMAMVGVDDDEEEAIRDLAPKWQKNSTFLYVGRDEKGNLRYFDMSFLDPYGYWKRPITAMLRNQPWEDSLASGLRGMLEPFLGADIAAKAIFEAVANQKESGGKVYKDKDGAIDQTVDIADHLRKTLQPGFMGNVERLTKAAAGVRKSTGQPYSVNDELVALVGWRATTMDPKTALYYRSFDFTDAMAEARKALTDTLRDSNSVSSEDIKDARQRAKAKQTQAFSEMHRLVGAAKAAGMTKMQIMQTLKMANISQANIGALMRGATPDVRVTPDAAQKAIRQARAMRGNEYANEVAQRYRQATTDR